MGDVRPVVQLFLVRMALVFFIGSFFSAVAFHQGVRSLLVQRLVFVVGIFVGGTMPIAGFLDWGLKAKGYILLLCVTELICMPVIVPFFIARTAGGQAKVKWVVAITIMGLYLLNMVIRPSE